MIITSDHPPVHQSVMNILLINVQTSQIGVNMDHIQRIEKFQPENDYSERIIYLDIALKLNATTSYHSPHILWIKNVEPAIGIIVDEPQKMLTISIRQISPLPPLVEKNCIFGAVWGAVYDNDECLLLIDLVRLVHGIA